MKKTIVKKKLKKKLLEGKALYEAMKKLQFVSGIRDTVAFVKKWR